MTAGRAALAWPATGSLVRAWARPALLLGGLAVVVWARRLALVDGRVDGLVAGAGFGLALALLAVAVDAGPRGAAVAGRGAGSERARLAAVGIGLGAAGGLALVGLALVARAGTPGPSFTPAVDFGPWLAVTLLVAGAEELLLRGVLFGALQRTGGVTIAVAVTSVAFALMHVPLYGWHVVPLDLGVGIFLGGLRLAGGGWQAPAIAHAIADLATWWL